MSTDNQTIDHGPWELGKKYLIRTVTFTLTGRLIYVGSSELLLEDAAWIADTGRYSRSLVTGDFSEIEPYPKNAIVGRGAVVDASIIECELPRVMV